MFRGVGTIDLDFFFLIYNIYELVIFSILINMFYLDNSKFTKFTDLIFTVISLFNGAYYWSPMSDVGKQHDI